MTPPLTRGVRQSSVVIAGLIAGLLITGCTAEDSETDNPSDRTTFTGISDPVTGTYTGTGTIQLGKPPENATHIDTRLTCLSAGNLIMENGLKVICPANWGSTTALSSFELVPGKQSVTVTSEEPCTKYKVIAVYQNRPSVR